MTGRLIVLATLLIVFGLEARAHEVRPAYLELTESAPERYDMVWKVPARGELTLRLEPRVPSCSVAPAGAALMTGGASIERSVVTCGGGLAGKSLEIAGLQATMTDVLVRIQRLDGATQTSRLGPDQPSMVVSGSPRSLEVARTYLGLGVEHILAGYDHLLFVMALLLLVQGWRRLAWTITAFTAAHSLTLATATFELVHVPSAIVEVLIALSIVLVAVEIVRTRQGEPGLAARLPWLIAFAFGLLHGLGFAGALAEVGLPAGAVPEALLFFNIGVEVGQLVVVALVVTIVRLVRELGFHVPGWSWRPATYAIGSLAVFWALGRLSVLT